jgi:hypothetical protein
MKYIITFLRVIFLPPQGDLFSDVLRLIDESSYHHQSYYRWNMPSL